ncbi:TolC family protein, partial [Pontibacter sp. 13R65]
MKLKHIIIVLSLTGLVSCRLGKEYGRPTLHLPAHFRGSPGSDMASATVPEINAFFRSVSLQRLVDTALHYNNDLLIAIKNIESARASFKSVRLNFLPDLNMQLAANRVVASRNSLAGIGNEQFIGTRSVDDYTASLGLSWEVDIWGKVKREKEEALARLLQTEEIRK